MAWRTEDPPPPDPNGRGPVVRITFGVARLAARPVRVVARSKLVRPAARAVAEQGRRGLEAAADEVLSSPETARVIDVALAGPLPEEVARAAVANRVPQRMAASLTEGDALEETVMEALENGRAEELARKIVQSPALERMLINVIQSPEMQRVLVSVASSPAVRTALTRQTAGFAEQIGTSLRAHTATADDGLERAARRVVRRRPRPTPESGPDYGGFITRALALAVDAAAAFVGVLVVGAILGLITLLAGDLKPKWVLETVLGSVWIISGAAYFTLFWSLTGQTLGMRLMHVRVVDPRHGGHPGFVRSLVRWVGLQLAIIPCFAGFLPALVDNRRRGLPDYLARTVVVDAEPD